MYSTVGALGRTQGTYLIRARSAEGAARKCHEAMRLHPLASIDVVDLAKVTNHRFWTSVRKLIASLDLEQQKYLPKGVVYLENGVYFAHEGELKGVHTTSI